MTSENSVSTVSYISGACNSTLSTADWGPNNLICFGIDSGIAILKTNAVSSENEIKSTLFAHSGRVNTVKWIKNISGNFENSFISTSVDNTSIIWSLYENEYIPKYVLKGHSETIIDADLITITLNNGNKYTIAATMSSDTVLLWNKSEFDDNFALIDTFYFKAGLGLSGIAFSVLPETETLVLAFPKDFVDIFLLTYKLPLNKNCVHSFGEHKLVSGHTNWISDLKFIFNNNKQETLLLASASFDCTIRIFYLTLKNNDKHYGLHNIKLYINAEEKQFSLFLHSVLFGHEQRIYSLQWKYFIKEMEEKSSLKLLSVSADRCAIIWHQDIYTNTWIENYRLGDVSENSTSFLGGKFDSTGQFVMIHDILGAFHVWKYNDDNDYWSAESFPSGHSDEITDIQWDPKGHFLLSVSADKTTRLHAPLPNNIWRELARPQTHGHSISCITVLPGYRFISGATEKELRYFIAPRTFIQNFKNTLFLQDLEEDKYHYVSAVLPSLDLSNKPANEVKELNIFSKCDINNYFIPSEDELHENTLWPEIQKLYYHPNEISCITSNNDGSLIASACKATSLKEATVAIWSIEKWDEIKRVHELTFHHLTVTALAFSPNNLYLLSVSRDRTWNLQRIYVEDKFKFQSVAFTSKVDGIHKRQLNCCSWSHDSNFFATGSKDGKLIIWGKKINDNTTIENSGLNNYRSWLVLTLEKQSVSSISFSPCFANTNEYIFAVGFDSSVIQLYIWNQMKTQAEIYLILNNNLAHLKAITRVVFRPVPKTVNESSNGRNILQLASCGKDRLLKIYDIPIPTA